MTEKVAKKKVDVSNEAQAGVPSGATVMPLGRSVNSLFLQHQLSHDHTT